MAKIKYTSVSWLKKNERDAIDETLAMVAYNPSIGRVLKKGSVVKFKEVAAQKVRLFSNIRNQKEFDDFHNRFVLDIMNKIKKTAAGKKISYGQGQKPVNVFLKIYVDWAGYPKRQIAGRVKKLLHVPLDRRVMWYIKDERRGDFDRIVAPVYKKQRVSIADLSLGSINRNMYSAWQRLCRKVYPSKPVLLDVIWAKAPR
jgi:hypothetical protein